MDGKFVRSALGAALTALAGFLLWWTTLGDPWVNASYDYLFRFASRPVTNKVVAILLDNEAYDRFHQTRGQPWDRGLHAELLNKLADDGCALVVFDSLFREPRDPVSDAALADAMRRQRAVVLMAKQADVSHPEVAGARPVPPCEPFLSAARTNWGVAWLDPDLDSIDRPIVRHHWPFPAPGPYPSLPWTAARVTGAQLDPTPREQWLRYYGENAWTQLSYSLATNQAPGYFRDRIVFIGTRPATTILDGEPDEFLMPSSRWTGVSVGGVQIMITAFLNLVNGDWLERTPATFEVIVVLISGVVLGGGLCRLRPLVACGLAPMIALVVALTAVSWSHFTNWWFPWLLIAGAQVPCAALCSLALQTAPFRAKSSAPIPSVIGVEGLPDTPDYELVNPPFGQGAYGKVWLARNAIGQWQALKAVYLANFGENTGPYDREFSGIEKYKPISGNHPGLLRVDFVSNKKPAGYFYYVMELGDALAPGWEQQPATYRPRDLASDRARAPGRRLSVIECVRIGVVLSEALDFLHRQGLTHRDIKPQNILFVNGRPKLADIGLVDAIRPPDAEGTYVGTPGYMPPPPEIPGTPEADIYALGMVLYTTSTGNNPAYFPDLATILVDGQGHEDFIRLNTIILKACQPDRTRRYPSAAEMHKALRELESQLNSGVPGPA